MKKGYQNEFEFINYLNGKRYGELNILIQDLLKKLYPDVEKTDIITAYKYGRYAKVDIVVSINGIEKGISIKSGSRNSIHIETIKKFVSYLKKINFNEIERLLRYLYSDGTIDNTGAIRQSSSEYKLNHGDDIILINDNLQKIKKELLIRFLIKTDVNYRINVDAFISGDVNDFLWATREEVIEYLTTVNQESFGVHISNLFIQNWNKNIKYNSKYEYCREYIQVKWYSIFDDLIRIMCNRNN